MDIQQGRALINEFKDLNRNLNKMTSILGSIDFRLKEMASGTSKNEQKAVEEKKDEGQ